MRKSYLILLLWFAIGIWLRFTELELKSPWTDEFSTIAFSLGNSFRNVPLNEAIPIDILLQPIVPNPNAGTGEVIEYLLAESNHPPLYFVLAHLWMKLFPLNRFDLLWVARSLPAILGAISIPAIYGLSCLAFRSRLVGNLAAAIMAVSPYGIFLAQEARHYTLAILFVIASLACLLIAVRHIWEGKQLNFYFSIVWIIINTLGIASHYFFAFTLVAELIVLFSFIWGAKKKNYYQNISSLLTVIVGTIAGGIVWLPVLQQSYNSQLTEWIKNSDRVGFEWIAPIFQALAAWITMLSLLPIEVTELPIIIVSGAVMLIFFVWAIPILFRGIKLLLAKPTYRLPSLVFGSFILTSITLFFSITYIFGIDLTRGARYNFVYFPAVIILIGASLALVGDKIIEERGKRGETFPSDFRFSIPYSPVAIILLMGFLSSLTVAFNLGYQKYYRPDLLVPVIEKVSERPVLIATTHKTHVQTGEMLGLAWEFKRLVGDSAKPQFLLAHQESKNSTLPTRTLSETIAQMPRPFDLWLVNFQASESVKMQDCAESSRKLPFIDGYDYQLYQCN